MTGVEFLGWALMAATAVGVFVWVTVVACIIYSLGEMAVYAWRNRRRRST